MCRDSSDFIPVFFFYTGFHFILFYFAWKQIIQEQQCFNVRKYLCPPFKKKKVSPRFSCKMHREKWPSPAFSKKKKYCHQPLLLPLKKKKKPLNDKVISNFKGHLTDSSGLSGILTALVVVALEPPFVSLWCPLQGFNLLSWSSIMLCSYMRMQENFYLKILWGGGCQALLIEKAFRDDPYFQLKRALTVLDLTPLPLQSDSHLAWVNQACD